MYLFEFAGMSSSGDAVKYTEDNNIFLLPIPKIPQTGDSDNRNGRSGKNSKDGNNRGIQPLLVVDKFSLFFWHS